MEDKLKTFFTILKSARMTGMTDAMRADFRIMKEVGAFTRLNPAQRQANGTFIIL